MLATLGIIFGALATVLSVWGMAWAADQTLPAPPQAVITQAFSPQASASPAVAPSPPMQEAAPEDHSYALRAGRDVPAASNARQVEPQYQLQANLVAVAYEICVGLDEYRSQYGQLPTSLSVADDGRLTTEGVTFSAVLPAYMRLSYAPDAPLDSAFVTIADAESGMAMSCVRSAEEMWIANS
ncbi:hypothetical protein ABZ477_14430 [Microbacterium sp. NPDC019599]|uniref:hypothetical protein n=1 Tax=Microbacterium sp. NPDC019599 TaxID=3154690 RepID=UPI0033CB7BA3